MNINRWGPLEGDNNATVPDGAPEGWVGANVNNWGRTTMGAVYRWYEYPEWIEITYRLTAVGVKSITKQSDTVFRIVSTNALLTVSGEAGFVVGRRIRLLQGATPFYGFVTAAVFSGGHTDVTVSLDSGVVPATIDSVWVHSVLRYLPAGSAGQMLQTDGVKPFFAETPVPRGYLFGCRLFRAASMQIQIGTGLARATFDGQNMRLATVLAKNLDAVWVAGTGVGGRAGALTNGTWYHVFLIKHGTTGVVDAGFDTDAGAVNLLAASGYTYRRRVGAIYYVDGATFIRRFFQVGNHFFWMAPVLDYDGAVTLTETFVTLSVPPFYEALAFMNVDVDVSGAALGLIYISGPAADDLDPTITVSPLSTLAAFNYVAAYLGPFPTDGTRQIRIAGSSILSARIATVGWLDMLDE